MVFRPRLPKGVFAGSEGGTTGEGAVQEVAVEVPVVEALAGFDHEVRDLVLGVGMFGLGQARAR